jgi:hypothetical protein
MVTAPARTYTNHRYFWLCQESTNYYNKYVVTQPILSSVTQPTCSVATGSFTITNYMLLCLYDKSVGWSYDFQEIR